MKKLITKLVTTFIVIFTVLVSAYTMQNSSNASELTHKIEYVQCVVIDNKVHECTNISSGKLIDTKKVKEVYNK